MIDQRDVIAGATTHGAAATIPALPAPKLAWLTAPADLKLDPRLGGLSLIGPSMAPIVKNATEDRHDGVDPLRLTAKCAPAWRRLPLTVKSPWRPMAGSSCRARATGVRGGIRGQSKLMADTSDNLIAQAVTRYDDAP